MLIAGCGWHLRGTQAMPASVQRLALDPDQPFEPLQRSLRAALKYSGVTVVPLQDNSAAVLRITEANFSRQDLTVSSQGSVSEQLIIFKVVFSLQAANGASLMPQQTVRIEHRIVHDENQLLRQEAEERRIEQSLRDDAAAQILQRIARQSRAKQA